MNKIIKLKKFVSGESRYCQNCGIESHSLFQMVQITKKIKELQYCEDCKKISDKKTLTINS